MQHETRSPVAIPGSSMPLLNYSPVPFEISETRENADCTCTHSLLTKNGLERLLWRGNVVDDPVQSHVAMLLLDR